MVDIILRKYYARRKKIHTHQTSKAVSCILNTEENQPTSTLLLANKKSIICWYDFDLPYAQLSESHQ